MLKRFVVVLISIMIIFALCNVVFAKDPFDPNRYNVTDVNAENTTIRFMGSLLDVIQVICVGIAVIVLIVLAIKYMGVAPDGKAEIKKNMVVYVIGAVVMFSAATIIEVLQKFFVGNLQEPKGGF